MHMYHCTIDCYPCLIILSCIVVFFLFFPFTGLLLVPLVLCRPTRLAQFVLHIVFSVNMYSVCTTVCEELNDDDDDDGDDGDGDELSKSLMIPLRL